MKNFTVMLLMIFALGITSVMAQGRSVSGKVTDSGTGLPVVGAMVIVQGSSNGAYTLEGGEFIIANVEGAVNFEVSFIGYTESLVPVSAAQTHLDIKLTPSMMHMDEVVVIAYGTADKKSLTGSVAVISSEDMSLRPITNATSAIAGMSAGITTTTASGAPGESASIRIRGIGSINSNSEPLYVVDGIPYTGNIANIAPEDIQSMSVLKDAASTALYGSRASNGVILIQTKSGRAGSITFDVSIKQGFMYKALPEYDKLEAMNWYELSWEGYRNGNLETGMDLATAGADASNKAFAADGQQLYNILTDNKNGTKMNDNQVFMPTAWEGYEDPAWTRGTLNPDARVMDGYEGDLDWMKEGFGIGYRQSYTISASGGSEKATYFASVGYTDEDGYFDHTSYYRINARARVDVTPTKWLKFGAVISNSYSDSQNPHGADSASDNPWVVARQTAPIFPVYLHDYNTGKYLLDDNGNKQYDTGVVVYDDAGNIIVPQRGVHKNDNVHYMTQLNKRGMLTATQNMQAYAAISFLNDFKFTVDGSFNHIGRSQNIYYNSIIGFESAKGGSSYNASWRDIDYNFKQMLEWGKSFEKHRVDILVAHENFQLNSYSLTAQRTGQTFPGSIQLSNFNESLSSGGTENVYRSEGYFGRANYNFDEKYYVSASFRRDGSSKFSPQSRWGNFWSLGATWIVSSEEFMSNVMWVNFLKLRASYGTNGNDGGFGGNHVGLYSWQTTYNPSNFIGSSALIMNNPGYPNLMWETAGALDLGIDVMLFNRLNATIGYFEKSSEELIFDVPVPMSSGITTEKQNIGAMTNRGVELSLDADIIRKKDWVWNLGLNLTWLQNRITALPGHAAETGIVNTATSKKLMIGHSIYSWYLPVYGGIDAEDGKVYYPRDPELISEYDFEIDGKWYTKSTANSIRDFVGDALSPISGSLTSSLSWKNLALDILVSFRIGGKAMDGTYNNLMSTGGSTSTDMLNSWRKPGDVTGLPRLNYHSNMESGKLIDNSYISLQNVTLSYTFPKKLVNKITLKGLSVFASGENLFQLSAIKGYDALASFDGNVHSGNRFGSMATVSFGINISF